VCVVFLHMLNTLLSRILAINLICWHLNKLVFPQFFTLSAAKMLLKILI